MANVMFKRGPSTNLPLETYKAQDGVFYLTTDTNRLYVGNGEKLAEINRYIKTVASRTALNGLNSQPGDFVYILEGNILAVYLSTTSGYDWVQVNVQGASVDTYVTGIKFETDAENSDAENTVYNLVLSREQKDRDGTTSELEDFVAPISIPVTLVGLEYDVADNSVSIKTSGNGSDGDNIGVTIAGGNGINISEVEGEVVVDGTTYELVVDETSIDLKDNNGSNVGKPVEFIGDEDWITVSNENGAIKVSHKEKNVAESTAADKNLSNEAEIFVVTGLTVDDNNHITGVEKTKLIAENTTYTPETEVDENGKLVVSLKDQDGTSIAADPLDISFKVSIDGATEQNINPGDSLGNIYSKEEMDRMFSALNAMTYMGAVNSFAELPTTGSKGDTYKAGADFSITIGSETVTVKTGDILILNGEENANGIVPEGNVQWDRIETGEAADTTYILSTSDGEKKILLTDSHGTAQAIEFEDDGVVKVEVKDEVISLAHAEITTEETTATGDILSGSEISVITGVTVDAHGHISGVETTTYTLAEGDAIEANATDVSLIFKDGEGTQQGSLEIEAGAEIEVTGTADSGNLGVTIEHKEVIKEDTTGTATPDHGGNFTVVESVTYNEYGHVNGVKTTTVTLPEETTYEIIDPVVGENKNSVVWELKDSDDNTKGSVEIASSSIEIVASETDASIVNMNLVWGTF